MILQETRREREVMKDLPVSGIDAKEAVGECKRENENCTEREEEQKPEIEALPSHGFQTAHALSMSHWLRVFNQASLLTRNDATVRKMPCTPGCLEKRLFFPSPCNSVFLYSPLKAINMATLYEVYLRTVLSAAEGSAEQEDKTTISDLFPGEYISSVSVIKRGDDVG